MQHPTCTNTRIRSVNDAHKIFYAVQQGVLRMVTRRLDTDERMQLRSGCVYAWEERGTHTEPNGLGIERFTEGRRWSPSRVRDEFLFYYEKYLPSFDCTNPHPPRDWDPLVKQTYSVWVETDRGRRKWHLTAYFTQATVDQLDSIDNMQVVRDFVVPESVFKSTRVTKSRDKNDTRKSSKFPDASTTSRWAPSPTPTLLTWPETSDQILMFQPYVYSNQVQTEVLDQQFLNPSVRSSNSINPTNFRDLDQHHTEAHPPSTYSRNPADNLRHDLREYHYMSQTVPVTDTTCSSASLSQTRPKGEQILPPHSVHTPATFLPANFSLSVTSDNTMHGYSSHDQFFPSTPSWEHVNSGSGNLNQRDGSANLAASATPTISSYLPFHNAISLDSEPESCQIMAPCLNPVHESPTRGNGTPRESLPSLITSTIMSPSFEAFSNKPSISATEPSQKFKLFLGSDEGSLDLAPLSVLSRHRPYRREPADDEVLRQLPRSP